MAARHYCAILLLGAASPAIAAQCDFMAATGDAQFTATNVRASPASNAKIVMTLEATAPVEVHVTGRRGDWYVVDRIIDAEQDRQLFKGTAWIHRSQLVLSVAGGSHRLYARPSRKSATVMRLVPDGNLIDIIDCKGSWVKAVVDKQATGWMASDAQCSNPMTTCS
jgi:SH3-like domain-containing protein